MTLTTGVTDSSGDKGGQHSNGDSCKVTCSLDCERPAPGPVTMVDQSTGHCLWLRLDITGAVSRPVGCVWTLG